METNDHSRLVLDVAFAGTESGTPVIQWRSLDFNSTPNQTWWMRT
ncbi:RICIN domain-containing protein [Kitasatospora sp. NPDC058218]